MIVAGRHTFTKWTDPPTLAALESQLLGAGSSQATLDAARRAWRRYASDAGLRAGWRFVRIAHGPDVLPWSGYPAHAMLCKATNEATDAVPDP